MTSDVLIHISIESIPESRISGTWNMHKRGLKEVKRYEISFTILYTQSQSTKITVTTIYHNFSDVYALISYEKLDLYVPCLVSNEMKLFIFSFVYWLVWISYFIKCLSKYFEVYIQTHTHTQNILPLLLLQLFSGIFDKMNLPINMVQLITFLPVLLLAFFLSCMRKPWLL